MRPPTTGFGMLLVAGATIGFASLGTLATIAYRAGMGSSTFVTLRAAIGALLLGALILRRPDLRVPLGTLDARERRLLLLAVALNGTFNLALFGAFALTRVAVVLAIYFSYPVMVALASVAIGRERFTATRIAGLLLAVAGVVVVLGDELVGAEPAGLGVALAALAAACQAGYIVVARSGFPSVPAEQAIALVLVGGAAMAAPLAWLTAGSGWLTGPWVSDPVPWLAVVAAAILGTAAAKVWVLRGLRLLGGTRTAVIMLGEPVGGALLAAVVLGQAIGPAVVGGGLLVLLAVVIVQRPAPGLHSRE